MTDVLQTIVDYKRHEVAKAKAAMSQSRLEREALEAPPVRPFKAALERRLAKGEWALIAEIKKASPSRGLIRADFNPPQIALAYESGGATCLSVLTDTPSFQGAPEHLLAARTVTSLPALRKDFMLDPYQVAQARLWGADCILLIMAMIDDLMAHELEDEARDWGMDVLAEVHAEEELERALRLKTRLIGINNRNLKTFETKLETTERLCPLIPGDYVIVAESGLFNSEDLARLSNRGVNAFLIGESLMRQNDVAAATRAILRRVPAAAEQT
jgi:indole-3-glycerol phosphate synthase